MASSSIQTPDVLIQELLQCAICLGQLSETRILPCCHSFCGPCLHTHIQTSLSRTFQYFPSFPCPTCRITVRSPPDGINGFLKDFRLVKFQDVLKSIVKQKKDDVCGICLNNNAHKLAKSFCTECEKYFCSECTEKHNTMSAFRSHLMFNLSQKELSSEQKCINHEEEMVRSFCKTCNAVLCVVCVLHDHSDHDVSNLSDVLSLQRKRLHRQQSELDNQISRTQSALFHLTCFEGQLKGLYEDSCLQIKKQSKRLVNRILSDENKSQKELDTAYAKKRDHLFVIKEDCRDHLVSYKTLHGHICCILGHDDTQEPTDQYSQLLEEIEKVRTNQTERWKMQEFETFLRFIPGHNFKFGKFKNVELKQESKTLAPITSLEANHDCAQEFTESIQTHEDTAEHLNLTGSGHAQLIQQNRNVTNRCNLHGINNYLIDEMSTSTTNIFPTEKLLSTQLVSMFGGFGRSAGDLSLPYNICFTPDGTLIVAENGNRRLQIFDKDGHSLNLIACGEIIPRCVTMVTAKNIAITDELTKSIKVFSIDGKHVQTLNPPASTLPYGLARTQSGNFVFTDMIFENVTIMSKTGKLEQQYGAHGMSNTTFNNPGYIDCDKQDNIYVSDSSNHSIKVFDNKGNFMHKFGSYGSQEGQLRYPKAVVVDNLGNVFVADSGNDRIVVFSSVGQFLQILITKSHGIQRPTGLACFGSELIAVSMPDLNEVRVYKLCTL